MAGGPGDDGKLPSVDHGRRTDRGRDKNISDFSQPKQDFIFAV